MGNSCCAENDVKNEELLQISNAEDVKFVASGFVQASTESISTRYEIQDVIGYGDSGKVRKAIHKETSQPRAIKTITKKLLNQKKQKEKFLKEVGILRELDHPNILQVYEFYEDKHNYHVVTELCTGDELFFRIASTQNFGEKKAAGVMKQVLSAVAYCHSKGFAHRDLNPCHIVYENNQENANVKVLDFGFAQVISEQKKFKGGQEFPYYVAPEVLANKANEKCDVWSCGVILYIMLAGQPPFGGFTYQEVLENVKRGEYDWPQQCAGMISQEAKDLVKKMLTKDVSKRPSAVQCLSHSWFESTVNAQFYEDPELAKAVTYLRDFHANQKLQQAVYQFIAAQLTTSSEKEELRKVFQSIDKNNDGTLSREELYECYVTHMSEVEAEAEVEKTMQRVDIHGNGVIDYTEFIAAAMQTDRILSKEKIVQCFNQFDKDGSGSISVQNLKALVSPGVQIADSVWKEILQQVDADGNGEIDLNEFKDMLISKWS